MIASMLEYALTAHPTDQFLSLSHNRMSYMFASDVMIRGCYPGYAFRYFEEHDIVIKKEPQDEEILKQGCVDFYSCSYYMTSCISTKEHAEKLGIDSVKGNLIEGLKNP